MSSILTKNQTKTYGPKPISGYGKGALIKAIVRYDDRCGNGYNTFSITGEIYIPGRHDVEAGGCIHKDIAQAFPDLAPLIKYHLCSSDMPMHYLANTLYVAGDKDCHGLRKGESRQIVNGKTKIPAWELVAVDGDKNLPKYADGMTQPEGFVRMEYRPWCRIGEGKERELDAARSAAVWLEATDEELTGPGLKERLEARLPALMVEFGSAVESLGFVW